MWALPLLLLFIFMAPTCADLAKAAREEPPGQPDDGQKTWDEFKTRTFKKKKRAEEYRDYLMASHPDAAVRLERVPFPS